MRHAVLRSVAWLALCSDCALTCYGWRAERGLEGLMVLGVTLAIPAVTVLILLYRK
jgi:hypothetical protein